MRRIKKFIQLQIEAGFRIPFISTNFHFGSNTALRILTAPLRSKVSALCMGAAGIGRFGIVQNFQMLSHSLGSLGLGSGLTAEISRRVKERDQAGVDEALRVSFSALAAASAVFTIFLMATRPWFALHFLNDPVFIRLIISPILALPFYCFGICYLEPILYGHSLQNLAARAYKLSYIADLMTFLPLVYFFNLTGASFSILFGSIAHFTTLLVLVRRACPQTKIFQFGFKPELFWVFFKTGMTMLLAGAAIYGVGLVIRAIIARNIGDVANGHYQVALALSTIYMPFITSATWVRLYPRVSGHGLDDSVLLEFTETLVYSAVFASLAQNFILIAPEFVIRVLYSKAFLPAAEIMPLRLIGDYGFLLAQPVLGVLLGLPSRRVFTFLNLASQALFAMLAYRLAGQGLIGLAAAYAIANMVLLAVCLHWYFRQIKGNFALFGMRFKIFALLALPLAVVCIQGYLSNAGSSIAVRAVIFLISCLGFFCAMKKYGIKDILSMRVAAHQNSV